MRTSKIKIFFNLLRYKWKFIMLSFKFCTKIMRRSFSHCNSSFRIKEMDFLAEIKEFEKTGNISNLDTPEMKKQREIFYQKNDFNPEHYGGDFYKMGYLQLISLILHWKLKSDDLKTKSLHEFIKENQEKYNLTNETVDRIILLFKELDLWKINYYIFKNKEDNSYIFISDDAEAILEQIKQKHELIIVRDNHQKALKEYKHLQSKK